MASEGIELPPDLAEIATRTHAANVLVPEFDWRRAHEAAQFVKAEEGGNVTTSSIIRIALGSYLDSHPDAAAIRDLAITRLRHIKELEELRSKKPDS